MNTCLMFDVVSGDVTGLVPAGLVTVVEGADPLAEPDEEHAPVASASATRTSARRFGSDLDMAAACHATARPYEIHASALLVGLQTFAKDGGFPVCPGRDTTRPSLWEPRRAVT